MLQYTLIKTWKIGKAGTNYMVGACLNKMSK